MRSAPALYLVTDRAACDRPLPEVLAAALSQVDPSRVAVQLREKDLSARELFGLGRAVLDVCRARNVRLLVNDRLDVALALGADGVHLGGGSLSAAVVRRVWPGALLGISSHTPEELASRANGADFAAWGPVFATPSKARYGAPVGTARLAEARKVGLPLVALGGVDHTNAAGLRAAGFGAIACIRAVFSAQDPAAAAANLLRAFDAA
ncbi:MAG: thiamine phosphate synthase [Myxococcales bacterium]